jgi:hypothetical protein
MTNVVPRPHDLTEQCCPGLACGQRARHEQCWQQRCRHQAGAEETRDTRVSQPGMVNHPFGLDPSAQRTLRGKQP